MSTILQVAGLVMALVVGVAFVFAYLKSNISKTTIDLYKADNEALRARQETIEEDGRTKDHRISVLEAQVKTLEGTREELLSIVTQKDAIMRIERGMRWLIREKGADYERL